MRRIGFVLRALAGLVSATALVVLGTAAPASAGTAPLTASVFANGSSLGLTGPDDLTAMGGVIYVAYQNGIGAMGEPSSTGAVDSDIVGYKADGSVIGVWKVHGKIDGMTADSLQGFLIATVNEDGNSSLYTIQPGVGEIHYTYQPSTLAHGGGTDAISVYDGQILISASAPNPAPANVPAVYEVTLSSGVASLRPFFSDEDVVSVANQGAAPNRVRLGLTDPDSNSVVPQASPRFAGDFMLNSQGDQQQIYVHGLVAHPNTMSVLNLSQAVDDTAWITDPQGTLYATDSSNNDVVAVHGAFTPGTAFASATPADSINAPANPGPNYLATLDLQTGTVTAVPGLTFQAKGLLYSPGA
jgi:hypothetical protein